MITGIGFNYESFTFPCGEIHVRLKDYSPYSSVSIKFEFQKSDELITLLLIRDAIDRAGLSLDTIEMPYVPFSRQDRVNVEGEPLSIFVLAKVINLCQARSVRIVDPHSDVTAALISRCEVIKQHEVFKNYFKGISDFWLISPDQGALKKIYKLSANVDCVGVIEFTKNRDIRTGEIVSIDTTMEDFRGKDCYILDDICDGGKTFVEIAKILKKRNCGKIVLMVTHGFFTKGLEVFGGLIDEIYTKNGRVK
ncbi:phosphoribosylpyrophosphate synthetase [Caudoviricetes sp.]|nr:phosphoribosylpyrophosphate synthetase [Caudoviricetes sp.]UOF80983.1 phosphoribosylpyrophosphate synthetase [Caudoviricetes sp.]UOF81372.1 phosphoribosylpyrophosphate synthetase [Caudoviricetes sp.]